MRPANLHVEARSVAEIGLDQLGESVEVDADLPHLVPVQQVEEVMENRPVRHRHHRLGQEVGQRTEARPQARSHHHCLHGSGAGLGALVPGGQVPRLLLGELVDLDARRLELEARDLGVDLLGDDVDLALELGRRS